MVDPEGASLARLGELGLDVLREILEQFPDAVTISRAVRDPGGRAVDATLLWMNAQARAGQPEPEAAIGGRCAVLWPQMVANGSFAACLRVLDSGRAEQGEFDWTEGESYAISCYEWRASRIGPDLLLWVLRDSSERLRRTMQSEATLQGILDAAPDVVLVIDERGTVQMANRATGRLLGWAPDELIGRQVEELMPRAEADAHQGYLDRYLATGERRVIGAGRDVKAMHRDGHLIPVRLSVGEARVAGRRLFTGMLHDLTLREQLEHQLRETAKLEAVARLASKVAHDVNNMLTVTTTATAMLEQAVIDPGTRELVSDITEATQRGIAMTRQLLTLARHQPTAFERVSPDDMLRQVARIATRLVGPEVTVTVRAEAAGWAVRADVVGLEQALVNLVVNARDAMPAGGTLRLSTLAPDEPGDEARVQFVVADSGQGMSEAVKARAFEPFFTTKPEGRGTGLGLASVQELAGRTGGIVTLDSAIGRGPTVTISLPAQPADPTSRPSTSEAPVGSERILLVDDDPTIRRVVSRALRRKGYQVDLAATLDEARACFGARGGFDALVTDIVLGRDDGRELARELSERAPDLRVLFVSGFVPTGPGLAPRSMFLPKPFTARELALGLRELLDRGRAAAR